MQAQETQGPQVQDPNDPWESSFDKSRPQVFGAMASFMAGSSQVHGFTTRGAGSMLGEPHVFVPNPNCKLIFDPEALQVALQVAPLHETSDCFFLSSAKKSEGRFRRDRYAGIFGVGKTCGIKFYLKHQNL